MSRCFLLNKFCPCRCTCVPCYFQSRFFTFRRSFPVDVFTFNVFYGRRFYFFYVLSQSTLNIFYVLSQSEFFPFNVLSHSAFFFQCCVHQCFFTVGALYFNVLPVKQKICFVFLRDTITRRSHNRFQHLHNI